MRLLDCLTWLRGEKVESPAGGFCRAAIVIAHTINAWAIKFSTVNPLPKRVDPNRLHLFLQLNRDHDRLVLGQFCGVDIVYLRQPGDVMSYQFLLKMSQVPSRDSD